MRASPSQISRMEQKLAALDTLSREELATMWVSIHDCPPPRGVKRQLLERAIAYDIQARALGRLPKTCLKMLLTKDQPLPSPLAASALKIGTRLIREWNGKAHVVDRIEAGFIWGDKTFSSLSAVARAITGARWSGPRFFGL